MLAPTNVEGNKNLLSLISGIPPAVKWAKEKTQLAPGRPFSEASLR
jgi:hypothetical protein